MKLGALFSGGKDSCLALHKAISTGHEIACLLSIFPENPDSYMFHKPDLNLLKKQAELLGIKLLVKKSLGEEEKELEDLKKLIGVAKEKFGVEGICVGGIASNYQGSRVKGICDKLGLKFYAPLWNYTPEGVWCELLEEGFKVVIIKIACEGLPKEMLGKVIGWDEFFELKKLSKKFGFRIDFEGGEAETAVLWMPEFGRKGKESENEEKKGKNREGKGGKAEGKKKKIEIGYEVISEGKHNHILNIIKIE